MPTPNPNTKVKHIYPGDVAYRANVLYNTHDTVVKSIRSEYPFSSPASELGFQVLVITTTYAHDTPRVVTEIKLFTVNRAKNQGRTWFDGDYSVQLEAVAERGQPVVVFAGRTHSDATSHENARKHIEAAATLHGYEIRGKE